MQRRGRVAGALGERGGGFVGSVAAPRQVQQRLIGPFFRIAFLNIGIILRLGSGVQRG